MTWVVGTAPPFGYSILVSDICVSFRKADGQQVYRDCLQKIYPMAPNILGGFAGSVRIGFELLGTIQYQLARVPQDYGWGLNVIANTWMPRYFRRIFNSASEQERSLSASVILTSAHPSLNNGDAPWPQTDVFTFKSPDFVPQKGEPFKVVAIGCGAAIPTYMSSVGNITSMDSDFLQVVTTGMANHAQSLAHALYSLVKRSPVPGISNLFQSGFVTRRQFEIFNHEYKIYGPDGQIVEERFPPIARNYKEFLALCQQYGYSAAEAVC